MAGSEANGKRRADAIIVGAGPAGSVAALLLARQGLDVLLLDRARFPRPKPCGDCLSAAATHLLDRIGLLDRVRAAGAAPVDHWEIVSADGTRALGRFGDTTALALERERLDAVLQNAAHEAGATVRHAHVTGLLHDSADDRRVTGVLARDLETGGDDMELRSTLVVGADGLRSIVARRLDRVRPPGPLRKVSLTAHVPAPPGGLGHGEMHLIPGGCVGYAPCGGDRCNLTVVVETRYAGDLADRGTAAFFRDRVAEADGLDPPGDLDDDAILASGPFDRPSRGSVARGAALVGDAAGYYDPFTGQGIYQAMAAAELLADTVGPALADGPAGPPDMRAIDRALRRYARERARLTDPARRVQRVVEWVLSRPALAEPVLRRLARAQTAMDRLIRVTGDLDHPRSLLSPAVLSSLILPPTRRHE